jgi:hypothetical protein
MKTTLENSALDAEGENKAVRSFLMLYGQPGLTVGQMKNHLSTCGFTSWPGWVENGPAGAHLTKAGAQLWLRHLFSLEAAPVTPPAVQPTPIPEGWVLMPLELTEEEALLAQGELVDMSWCAVTCFVARYKAAIRRTRPRREALGSFSKVEQREPQPLTAEQCDLLIDGHGEEGDEDYLAPIGDGGITQEDLVLLIRRVEAVHLGKRHVQGSDTLQSSTVPAQRYTVKRNECNCHPETCNCMDWAIYEGETKQTTFFAESRARAIADAMNKILHEENEACRQTQ